MKKLLRLGALFLAVMTVLYGTLVLSCLIPNEAIRENMASSARFFLRSERYVIPESGRYRGITDNYADQIWVNIAWQMGRGDPMTGALNTGYYNGGSLGWAAGLDMAVRQDMSANTPYTRYWHGTGALIRLGHLFTDVQGIRAAGLVVLLTLILLNLVLLVRRGYWDVALGLTASLLLVQVWILGLSLEYLPSFLVCFAMLPAFLRLERKGNDGLYALVVISGCATAFFDFLTTETVTILLPLILILAVRGREGRLGSGRDTALWVMKCLILWLTSYGAAFLLKWLAASLVTGENQFLGAIRSAAQRVDGNSVDLEAAGMPKFLAGILGNLSAWLGAVARLDLRRALVGILLLSLGGMAAARRVRKYPGEAVRIFAMLLLGALVVLRFGVLGNHAFLHQFFTYRALVSPILAILLSLIHKR